MTTRWARFARGWIAAGFATFVAAFFHVAAGGSAPGLVPAAVSLAFSAILCIALAGKTLSLLRQTIAVSLSQVIFHALFSLGNPVLTVADHVHGAAPASVPAAEHATMHMTMPLGSWMWAGHAAAAVLTIAMLRYGEGVIWRLRELARMGIGTFFAAFEVSVVPDGPRMVAPASAGAPARRDLWMLVGSIVHRGPPRPIAAL